MMQQAGKVGNPAGGAHPGCRGRPMLRMGQLCAAHADQWSMHWCTDLMLYCLGCWLQSHKELPLTGSTLHIADCLFPADCNLACPGLLQSHPLSLQPGGLMSCRL